MSKTKPIPMAEKPSNTQPKANSLPRSKTPITKTTSSPVFMDDRSSIGAKLRRQSDAFFHSNEQLPLDETDSFRRSNASLTSSEGDERTRSASTASTEKASVDAWLEWLNLKKRRNSSPAVTYGGSVGTSV